VIKLAHEKLRALIVFITIFAVVGGVSWALVSAQQSSQPQTNDTVEPEVQVYVRNAVIAHLESSHPETAPLLNDLNWSGGRVETGLLGSETYLYESHGLQVTIQNAVVLNPMYSITVHYALPQGEMGIPYNLTWEGTLQDGTLTESAYSFAQ
jgi:hypothetical protein